MSERKLTAPELSLLLDPDCAISGIFQDGCLPERWERLQNRDGLHELIKEMKDQFVNPTKFLAGYEEIPLRARVTLPQDMEPYMKEFLKTLIGDTNLRTRLEFQIPDPLFRNEHFDLEITIPRHQADLSTIAFEGSRRLTLSEDSQAFTTLQKSGKYRRGNFDVSFSWYPGREKIKHWRCKAWAESSYQWCVQLPSALLASDEQSIRRGLYQLVSGVGITVNRCFGIIPTKIPKYTVEDIDRECARAYFAWLEQSEGFALTATEVIASPRHRASWGSMSYAPTKEYPALFEHPVRGQLDFRTFIPDVQVSLQRILEEARHAVEKTLGPRRMVMINSELSHSLGSEESVDVFLDAWHNDYLQAIEERRRAIDRLSGSPDLTSTVLKEQRAQFLIGRLLRLKKAEVDERFEQEMDLWKESHPFKAASEKYVAREYASITGRIQIEDILCEGLSEALLEAGLTEYALLVESQQKFGQSTALSKEREDMVAARKAAALEISLMKLPKNWTIKQFQVEGTTVYLPEIYRKVSILSSTPLWRVLAFGTRYFSWIWNGTFVLINTASVATRRWNICRESFQVRTTQVDDTGEFRMKELRTIRGRLAAISKWRRSKIEIARNGEHIIRLKNGLYLDMCWVHSWTGLALAIGDVSLISYSVIETVVSLAFAGVGLVTAPVWSLAANTGYSLYTALIYDRDLPHEDGRSPLLLNQFGLPNIIISTGHSIFHFLKGVVVGLLGEIRHAWNRTWHGLMTIVLRRAEIPTQAEGFFWSTSGPGMKTPFVLIDSDTATLALLAYLSREELSAGCRELNVELQAPRRDLEERVKKDSGGAMRLQDIRIVAGPVTKAEMANQHDLKTYPLISKTDNDYADLISSVWNNMQIRMKQEDLVAFFSRAIPLTKKFYIERLFTRLTFYELVEFWESRNLVPGDWQGLTEYSVSDIFTREIIIPFEAASDDLVVEANQVSGLETIIEEALTEQGVVTGISTSYHLRNPIKPKRFPRSPEYASAPIRFTPQPNAI